MIWNQRKARQENRKASGVRTAWGSLFQLGWHLYRDGATTNFMISGGVDLADRYAPLRIVIQGMIGHCPIIVLHSDSTYMEQLLDECWQAVGAVPEECPLWISNQQYRDFEPFFGMSEMQVVSVLRTLATKLGYSATPRFERVVRAHLTILRELDIPYSLTGLNYLCSIDDMREFYDNVLALPCGEAAAKRIWADLGVSADDANSQFDLFRSVISSLSYDALRSGWNEENVVAECNCITALRYNGVFALSICSGYTNLLLPYLCEELKSAYVPYMLIVDDVRIDDESFTAYLCAPQSQRCLGVIGQNVSDILAAGSDDAFRKIAERMDKVVILKHSTGVAAEAFSELIGKFDYIKVEESSGTNKKFGHILYDDSHVNVTETSENRYRVMPESIIGLGAGQAIVFDTENNEIVYFK